ncbi:MAG: SDR family oxidoreductase [Mesorhizobium sp.]
MAGERGSRVALVTGGASGIGWATARRFAEAGYAVLIADLDGARAIERAATLGPSHRGCRVDISGPASVRQMVDDCMTQFGRLDVLVNNAGRTTNGGLGLVDQPADVFDNIFDVNFEGAMVACDAAASVLAATGGSIVNVASGAAFRALPLRSSYSASKAAVVAASQKLAEDLAPKGIRVNVVAPGFVRTELLDDLINQGRLDPAQAVSKIPLGRMGTPDDLAEAIHFVATQGAFTGAVLNVDGGSQAFGGSGAASMPEQHAARSAGGTEVHLFIGAREDLARRFQAHKVFGVEARQSAIGAARVSMGQGVAVAGVKTAADLSEETLHGLRQIGPLLSVVDYTQLDEGSEALGALHAIVRKVGPSLLETRGSSLISLVAGADDALAAGRAAGLDMLVKTLACEWGSAGVRANSLRVAAGQVDELSVTDAVKAIGYLTSEAAGFVTGAQLDLRLRSRAAGASISGGQGHS